MYKSSRGHNKGGVIAAEIRISLCSPRRVFAAPPKALLPSFLTAPTLTLSSLGPEQRITRSHHWKWRRRKAPAFCCCLWSLRTSSTSSVNDSKPSLWCMVTAQSIIELSDMTITTEQNGKKKRTLRAPMICSGAMVFFESCSQISFASDEIRCMNSRR